MNPPEWLTSAIIRAARTFLQAFIAVYLAALTADRVDVGVLEILGSWSFLDQAATAGLVAVLSFAQNLLEGAAALSYRRG